MGEIEENRSYETFSSFDEMNLKLSLMRGIYQYGFETPSPIQSKAIIPFTQNNDMIAQAQSGTGKTATFSIAVLQNINEDNNNLQAILVAPTRELASQIHYVIGSLGKHMNVKSRLMVGGQRYETINSQIIVGTPGRILDCISRNIILIDDIINYVMDEADELLSPSFREQIRSIIAFLPQTCKIGLYSATVTPEMLGVTKLFLKNPLHILIKQEQLTLEGIRQYYIDVQKNHFKYETLKDIYNHITVYQLMIYCNQKSSVDKLYSQLRNDGFTASCIHGQLPYEERMSVMKQFRSGETRILISTDLLSRGIDVQQVSLVINYELPPRITSYIHRIGRSGRYGRKGYAINFVTKQCIEELHKIESYYSTEIRPLTENISEDLQI
tara:strand:+ start:3106 stop:4257 length:1152 start_codon:yes stop_codon:yes gene_type:complete